MCRLSDSDKVRKVSEYGQYSSGALKCKGGKFRPTLLATKRVVALIHCFYFLQSYRHIFLRAIRNRGDAYETEYGLFNYPATAPEG